jgi:methionyl-tRNA formyltransferase
VVNGDAVTGVTAMFMNEGMDTGDMAGKREVAVGPDDTAGTMHEKLAAEGAVLLLETLEAIRSGTVVREPQDESKATYAPKLTKQDGRIDWTAAAGDIQNRVRGLNPWPCCYCEAPGPTPSGDAEPAGSLLRILRARAEACGAAGEGRIGPEPGTVLELEGEGPLIACGRDALRLLDVQPEGKKAMSGDAYLRGHGLQVGDRIM